MKKKILMLVLAVTMACLIGCGKKETPVVPNIPNQTDSTIVESGENLNVTPDISGEQIVSGEAIAEEFDKYAELPNMLPDEIKAFASVFYNIELYLSADNAEPNEFGVSSLIDNLRGKEDPYASISYLLKDLNNDGVEELMLFDNTATGKEKNVIISMYTIANDDCYHILNSQKDYYFKLCENNVLSNDSIVDAQEIKNYWDLNQDNSLEELESTSDNGTVVEYKEIELTLTPLR